MDRNKTAHYKYIFSNGVEQIMSPLEAHQYANRLKIDIFHGPNYVAAKREKSFNGWGWHDSLLMTFRGPAHYRQYLKENNMHEASVNDRPMEEKYNKPLWDEDLIRKANGHGMDIGSVLAEALLNGELDYPEGNCDMSTEE